MQVILLLLVSLFVLGLVIAILKKLIPALIYSIKLAVQIVIGVLVGIPIAIIGAVPYLCAISINTIFTLLKIREKATFAFAGIMVPFLLALCWASIWQSTNINFHLLKYIVPAVLMVQLPLVYRKRMQAQQFIEPHNVFSEKEKEYFDFYLTAFFFVVTSIAFPDIAWLFGMNYSTALEWSWIYWFAAIATQYYWIKKEKIRLELMNKLHSDLDAVTVMNSQVYLNILTKNTSLTSEEVEAYFYSVASLYIMEEQIKEETLIEDIWFFNNEWLENKKEELNRRCSINVKNTQANINGFVAQIIELPQEAATEFAKSHLDFCDTFLFQDDQYVVSYDNRIKINTCVCCGFTVEKNSVDADESVDWYCSEICRETEKVCLELKNKPMDTFLADAAVGGFVVMSGANAWSQNHKMFAAGGQGHGFAAENANDMIDKMSLKNAKVVGGNNAKDGADRVVNSQQIQTKYCATGRRSVNEAFAGDQGPYRYMDESGKPMQLEVPKDQYNDALRTMQRKIEDGKVPGVSDPKEAVKIIRKGNVTYKQAVNITKFGTFESITYDLAEGAVVGLAAGGISFGISTLLYYMETNNRDEALRIGAIQGGKAFGKSLSVYVVTQQLHRVALVQKTLGNVGISSPTLNNALSKGMGVSSGQVNNVLRGTIVSSVAVIAITTGPDLIKLIQGRISAAQFIHKLAVATGGVGGSVAGSLAGGVIFSPLGPVGAIAGRFIGGVVGGMTVATIVNKIGKSLRDEDRVKMLRIIKVQMGYLARTFMLNEHELDNLNQNLDKVIKPESLEMLYAADNRIAMSNFFVKPVVVSIVKQRPALSYSAEDLVEAYEELAA